MKIKNFGCWKEDYPLAEGYSYGIIFTTPPKAPNSHLSHRPQPHSAGAIPGHSAK